MKSIQRTGYCGLSGELFDYRIFIPKSDGDCVRVVSNKTLLVSHSRNSRFIKETSTKRQPYQLTEISKIFQLHYDHTSCKRKYFKNMPDCVPTYIFKVRVAEKPPTNSA